MLASVTAIVVILLSVVVGSVVSWALSRAFLGALGSVPEPVKVAAETPSPRVARARS